MIDDDAQRAVFDAIARPGNAVASPPDPPLSDPYTEIFNLVQGTEPEEANPGPEPSSDALASVYDLVASGQGNEPKGAGAAMIDRWRNKAAGEASPVPTGPGTTASAQPGIITLYDPSKGQQAPAGRGAAEMETMLPETFAPELALDMLVGLGQAITGVYRGPKQYLQKAAKSILPRKGYEYLSSASKQTMEIGFPQMAALDKAAQWFEKASPVAQKMLLQKAAETGGAGGLIAAQLTDSAMRTLYSLLVLKAARIPYGRGAETTRWGRFSGELARALPQTLLLSAMDGVGEDETWSDVAKRFGVMYAFMATPSLSGLVRGDARPKVLDFMMNLAVSKGLAHEFDGNVQRAKQLAAEFGRPDLEKPLSIALNIGTVGQDAFFSAMVQGFRGKKGTERVRRIAKRAEKIASKVPDTPVDTRKIPDGKLSAREISEIEKLSGKLQEAATGEAVGSEAQRGPGEGEKPAGKPEPLPQVPRTPAQGEVRSLGQLAQAEGIQSRSLSDIVRSSMEMNPDRIAHTDLLPRPEMGETESEIMGDTWRQELFRDDKLDRDMLNEVVMSGRAPVGKRPGVTASAADSLMAMVTRRVPSSLLSPRAAEVMLDGIASAVRSKTTGRPERITVLDLDPDEFADLVQKIESMPVDAEGLATVANMMRGKARTGGDTNAIQEGGKEQIQVPERTDIHSQTGEAVLRNERVQEKGAQTPQKEKESAAEAITASLRKKAKNLGLKIGANAKPDEIIDKIAEQNGARAAASAEREAVDEATDTGSIVVLGIKGEKLPTASVTKTEARRFRVDTKVIPNFKRAADKKGLIQKLKGIWSSIGTPPILVWVRKNGKMYVASGRHRFDLFKRTARRGARMLVQYLRESEGYDRDMVMTMDAEDNIRAGRGDIDDFALYFRNKGMTEDEAAERGLLTTEKGRQGFYIGKLAGDDLYAAFTNGKVRPDKVATIAKASEGDIPLQLEGIRYSKHHNVDEIGAYLDALRAMAAAGGLKPSQDAQQTFADILGGETFKQWQEMAERASKYVSEKMASLVEERKILKHARGLKGKKAARFKSKYGFDPGDQEAIGARMGEIRSELDAWEHYTTNPELTREVNAAVAGENGRGLSSENAPGAGQVPAKPAPKVTVAKKRSKVAEYKPPQGGQLFGEEEMPFNLAAQKAEGQGTFEETVKKRKAERKKNKQQMELLPGQTIVIKKRTKSAPMAVAKGPGSWTKKAKDAGIDPPGSPKTAKRRVVAAASNSVAEGIRKYLFGQKGLPDVAARSLARAVARTASDQLTKLVERGKKRLEEDARKQGNKTKQAKEGEEERLAGAKKFTDEQIQAIEKYSKLTDDGLDVARVAASLSAGGGPDPISPRDMNAYEQTVYVTILKKHARRLRPVLGETKWAFPVPESEAGPVQGRIETDMKAISSEIREAEAALEVLTKPFETAEDVPGSLVETTPLTIRMLNKIRATNTPNILEKADALIKRHLPFLSTSLVADKESLADKAGIKDDDTINLQADLAAEAVKRGFVSKEIPGYRSEFYRLLLALTGKSEPELMTKEELELVLAAIKRVSSADEVPDRISDFSWPTRKKLSHIGRFFHLNFITSLFKSNYGNVLDSGLEVVLKPAAEAERRLELAMREAVEYSNKTIDAADKRAGEKRLKVLLSRRGGRPTATESRIAELLDKYDDKADLPPETPDHIVEAFDKLRQLHRDLIRMENIHRALRNEDPIPYRRDYIRHVVQAQVDAFVNGSIELAPYIYADMKKKGIDPYFRNNTERERFIQYLTKEMSRDLRTLVRSSIWYSMREMYLTSPKIYAKAAIEKLMPDPFLERILPRGELEKMQLSSLPKEAVDWAKRFVSEMLDKEDNFLDAKANRFLITSRAGKGISALFNLVMRRPPRRRAMTRLAINLSKGPIYGALGSPLGGRDKAIVRNILGQGIFHDLVLYGINATARSRMTRSPKLLKAMRDESVLLREYVGVPQSYAAGMESLLSKVFLWRYSWSAVHNATRSWTSAWHRYYEFITDKKYRYLGWASPKRDYTEPEWFLYPEERKLLGEMCDYSAQLAQYGYTTMLMPQLWRYKALRPALVLGSWGMHAMRMAEEMLRMSFNGRLNGMPVPPSMRMGALEYILFIAPWIALTGVNTFQVWKSAPTHLGPPGEAIWAIIQIISAKTDRQKKDAEYRLKNSIKLFIPGYIWTKELKKVIDGEKDWTYLFFYRDPAWLYAVRDRDKYRSLNLDEERLGQPLKIESDWIEAK